jgi:hypothetical protein
MALLLEEKKWDDEMIGLKEEKRLKYMLFGLLEARDANNFCSYLIYFVTSEMCSFRYC